MGDFESGFYFYSTQINASPVPVDVVGIVPYFTTPAVVCVPFATLTLLLVIVILDPAVNLFLEISESVYSLTCVTAPSTYSVLGTAAKAGDMKIDKKANVATVFIVCFPFPCLHFNKNVGGWSIPNIYIFYFFFKINLLM